MRNVKKVISLLSAIVLLIGILGGCKDSNYINDANIGTKEQFREFVDTAHKHSIRVVLDVILNHSGFVSLKDMDEYSFGKSNDNWKDYYYSDSKKSQSSKDQNYMDINDKEAWEKWWGSECVRASQKYYGYNGSTSGSDKTMCLSGLPDFKTETTYDPGIPEIWKTKWTKEGRCVEYIIKMELLIKLYV